MTIKFKVDGDKLGESLTFDELIALQEGQARAVRDVLARYMVDEQDVSIPPDEASKVLGAMKLAEVADIAKQFTAAIQDKTANPTNGGK